MGDDYAKGWVISEFGRHGILFEPRPTEMTARRFIWKRLPLFSAGRVRLLDNAQFDFAIRRAWSAA